MQRLSPYAEQVASDVKERYKEKISIISGSDPFLGHLGTCTETVPSVEASDLVSSCFLLGVANWFSNCQTIYGSQINGSLQPVCVWMGEEGRTIKGGKYLTTGHVSSLADLIPF